MGVDESVSFTEQRRRVLQVIDKIASKAEKEFEGEDVTVKFGRICVKADAKTQSLLNRGYQYTIEDKPGLDYVHGKGLVRITPGEWRRYRENRGEWSQGAD